MGRTAAPTAFDIIMASTDIAIVATCPLLFLARPASEAAAEETAVALGDNGVSSFPNHGGVDGFFRKG